MKENHIERLQVQLDEWSAEIDKLKAQADKAKVNVRVQYQREVEQLRGKAIEARAKLEGLKGAREVAWEDMKAGAEEAWEALGTAIRSAGKRFE